MLKARKPRSEETVYFDSNDEIYFESDLIKENQVAQKSLRVVK